MVLFENEQALVTGAASNIGAAIARRLAREGAAVLLADIDGARLDALAEELRSDGFRADALVCDLSTADGWRAVTECRGGTDLSLFVHSASPARREGDDVGNVSEEVFDRMLNTNLRSGFFIGRELGARMQARGIRGRMLFISSLHKATPRNLPHYSASKAGMTMIVAELARYFGPAGIRVNALAPGAIPGGGFKPDDGFEALVQKIPLRRAGTADDIAASVMALLSDDFCGYVTGTTLTVDGGIELFNWIDPPH